MSVTHFYDETQYLFFARVRESASSGDVRVEKENVCVFCVTPDGGAGGNPVSQRFGRWPVRAGACGP